MRTTNAQTKKQVWRLEVSNLDGSSYIDKNYATLEEISKELEISYNQVCDLKCGRVKQHPLMPKMVISRRLPTQTEYYNEKRKEKNIKEIEIF
jgi:hypothetical protein|tara:strand:- start:3906 stop:4184 length:279 start_codon:yes stop_codon:yes gene_type:complete